jgi:hypothetical protein
MILNVGGSDRGRMILARYLPEVTEEHHKTVRLRVQV